jgi:hypothetical protein
MLLTAAVAYYIANRTPSHGDYMRDALVGRKEPVQASAKADVAAFAWSTGVHI